MEAARAVAAAHGADVSRARVLSDRSNLIVSLDPTPAVARVATTTAIARVDVEDFFAREVAVACFLAGRSARVIAPSGVLPPGPHPHDGLVVSFWEPASGEPDRAAPEAVAVALRALHAHLRAYPGPLPRLWPALEEPLRLIGLLECGGALALEDVMLLRDVALRLAPALAATGPDQPLHGDAHVGNVWSAPDGLRFADLEDTCAGPVEWDLACLLHRHRDAPDFACTAESVLRAYGADLAPEALTPFLEARSLQTTVWRAFMAPRFPEQRQALEDALRGWRER